MARGGVAVARPGSRRTSQACPRQRVFLPRRGHGSALFVPSAGCFFGDEVRGSGESCAPSDTDASSEAERPGPDRPGPAESGDSPGKPRDSLAPGSGTGRATEPGEEEAAGPAIQTPGLEPCPGPASTLAELPWTNIDLKEPRRAPGRSAAGFPETTGLSSLGLLPLGLEEPYGADDHPLWAWVSGGDCAVEAHTVLKWFTVQSGEHRCPGAERPRGCSVLGEPTRCPAWTPPLVQPACQQLSETSGAGRPFPSPCPGSGGLLQAGLGPTTLGS